MKTIETFYEKMPTQAQFELFLAGYEKANEEMQKNADYRMQNYYNCVDDYSWGGLCDQAANELYRERKNLKDNLETQFKEGAFVETIETSILCDMDGNVISDRIVNGKFGECWIIKNGSAVSFVSVAKKQSTYNKKGYKAMTIWTKVEYYYLTSGKIISRILWEKIMDKMLDYQTTYKHKAIYCAN
jgi:hypothetical protein